MRTWHSSATPRTSSGPRPVTRTRNASVGTAVCAMATTSSTTKSSSGIARPHDLGAAAQVGEEGLDRLPHLAAAGKAPPAHADDADEPEALVDRRDEVVVRPSRARAANAVDQEGLDVGLELAQDRVGRLQRLPALQRQQRLGRAGGARVER